MKEFTVKVTSITTLTVEAKNEDEAIDRACSEAWEHDADEINAEILEEDEEAKNIRDDLEAICGSEKSVKIVTGTCKTCGEDIDDAENAYIVNPGLPQEYHQCWACHVSDSDNGRIIQCEACGDWFSADVLHDEVVAGQSFCACPSCGRDVVEGCSREEFVKMGA